MHIDLHVLILDAYSELRTWYHLQLLCYSTSNCTYDSADSIKCHFFSQTDVCAGCYVELQENHDQILTGGRYEFS